MHSRNRENDTGRDAALVTKDLSLFVAGRRLMGPATFAVPRGRKVALVGRNGSGKSTLLETVATQAATGRPPEHVELSGTLRVEPGALVAALPQSPLAGMRVSAGATVSDYLDTHAGEVGVAWSAYRRWSDNLAAGDDVPATLRAYGEALEAVQRLDAWDHEGRREEVLEGLGLGASAGGRRLADLSGGELTRVALAAVLLSAADLLLLDEPSNNLDAFSLDFLGRFVRDTAAAVLLVSHDRDLLDETVTQVLEIVEESSDVALWGGGYSFYAAQKQAEYEARLRAFQQQERRRGQLQASIAGISARADRFQDLSQHDYFRARGAKVAKSARAQATRVERELRELDQPYRPLPPRFVVEDPSIKSGTLIRLNGVDFAHRPGAAPLFDQLDLSIRAGRRLALVGPSGSGKTTLLRLLLGELKPRAGVLEVSPGVRAGYLAQRQPDPGPEESVLDYILREHPGPAGDLRAIAGRVLFRDPAGVRAAHASEGELRRAEVAAILGRRPDLLLLDEPTNHLDLTTIEMLEAALRTYRGAVVAASHDRRFLRRLGASETLHLAAARIGT